MKQIKYDKEFKAADGQPFQIPDPDVKTQNAAQAKALEEGKEFFQGPRIDGDFAQVMCWFVNNIPHGLERDKDGKIVLDQKGNPQRSTRKLTPEDAGNAYAVIKAFRNPQNGYVELEEAVYKWLLELNETDGVEAFRITQGVVAERLQDTVKEEKKETAKVIDTKS